MLMVTLAELRAADIPRGGSRTVTAALAEAARQRRVSLTPGRVTRDRCHYDFYVFDDVSTAGYYPTEIEKTLDPAHR